MPFSTVTQWWSSFMTSVIEMHGGIRHLPAFRLLFLVGLNQGFVMHAQLEAFGVLAGIAILDGHAELVVARRRRSKCTAPSEGVVVAVQSFDGNGFVPTEIDAAVGTGENRGSANVF